MTQKWIESRIPRKRAEEAAAALSEISPKASADVDKLLAQIDRAMRSGGADGLVKWANDREAPTGYLTTLIFYLLEERGYRHTG